MATLMPVISASLLPITLKQRRLDDSGLVALATSLTMKQVEQMRDELRVYPSQVTQLRSTRRRLAFEALQTRRGRVASASALFYQRTMNLYNSWKIEPQPTSAGNITIRLSNDAREVGAKGRGRPYAVFVHGSTRQYGTSFHRAHGWRQMRDVYPRYRQSFYADIRPLTNAMTLVR